MLDMGLEQPQELQYFLTIGQGAIFETPSRVMTVLGSCVSVTIFYPKRKVGGMFHALLPSCRDYPDEARLDPYKYVDSGVKKLCALFMSIGAAPPDLECKVFGGSNSLFEGEMCVGKRNAAVAIDTLRKLHLRVFATDIGGRQGRKLLFTSHTGEVLVRRVRTGNLCGA